jgi:hypothetical protein
MVQRPAFLARLTSRFPDFSSLRVRYALGSGFLASVFGACLVLAAALLDARRCAEVARERAETLARTAGFWLDGDAHSGLGNDPEKRLDDLAATLGKLVEASDFDGTVRTLRPKGAEKDTLATRPGSPRPAALEVVLQTGANAVRKDVDYRPEMRAALFEGHVASWVEGGRVLAYAPIPDAWGGTPALIAVDGPASAPLWRRILFPLGAALFAGLLVWATVLWARRVADGLAHALALLEASASGAGAVTLPRGTARELVALGASLESQRPRPERPTAAVVSAAPVSAPPTPLAPPSSPAPSGGMGEPSEFDLALLMQQLLEPARNLARSRGIEVQLVFPDGLPSQLVGHPEVLFRALDSLLRSALRTTRQGRITLRVSRANVAGDPRLRFEVADTSAGIAFKDQPALTETLAKAAGSDAASLQDPLELSSALVNALGGELSFVSQPGQGSRFGFSIGFVGLQPGAPQPPPVPQAQPTPRTAFLPAPGTAFQPRASIPLGPPNQAPGRIRR